jgi:Uma2 family endonuclease
VFALPDDGRRYELIDGELIVTPAPRGLHQAALMALMDQLKPFVDASGVGKLLISPADISLGEDEILQPDLFVYRTATGKPLREWSDIAELLLVVEISSPSTARFDRELKRRRYQRVGIPEYWIVDLDGRVVERWRPEDTRPEALAERLQWSPAAKANLDLDLVTFFQAVWGE